MDTTAMTEKTVAQRLDEENARAAQLDALITGLELVPKESLGLSEHGSSIFEQIMAQLSYQEFVNLPTKKGLPPATVLGIENHLPTGSLSYTDRKALRKACMDTTTRRIIDPALNFMEAKRREPKFNVFQLKSLQRQIVDDEERRQKLQSDLVAASMKRFDLMQQLGQIKAGNGLADEMEETKLRLRVSSEKTSLVNQMVKREFCLRTEHAAKALQQAEGFLDAAIQSYQK